MAHKHHDAVLGFQRWNGHVPEGFAADFLGVKTRSSFASWLPPQPKARYEAPPYPTFDEEYFEWIDLLDAVVAARDRFTMLELGAGWGRWTARAAVACRQRGIPYRLVAVEAEPTHFAWMIQNLGDNGILLENCRLIQAAVTGTDGKVGFEVGNAGLSYGNSVCGSRVGLRLNPTEVESVSLASLLVPLDEVDLIDMDVQGVELEVISTATVELGQKVKRLRVETHDEYLHDAILKLLGPLGWKLRCDFAGNTADRTPWGRINFQEGCQTWLNPHLLSSGELHSVQVLRNSPEWRLLGVCRALVNKVAPQGTKRRRIFTVPIRALARKYRRDPEHAAHAASGWR